MIYNHNPRDATSIWIVFLFLTILLDTKSLGNYRFCKMIPTNTLPGNDIHSLRHRKWPFSSWIYQLNMVIFQFAMLGLLEGTLFLTWCLVYFILCIFFKPSFAYVFTCCLHVRCDQLRSWENLTCEQKLGDAAHDFGSSRTQISLDPPSTHENG